MESLFLELKNILEIQKQSLEQLLDTARVHNRALRQLNTEVLNLILRKEEEITALIRKQDKKRESITENMAQKLGLPKDITLNGLVAKAPLTIKEALNDLVDSVNHLVLELTEINGINGALSKQAMRFNEMLLKVIAPVKNQVYAPGGRMTEDNQSVLLLDKKV